VTRRARTGTIAFRPRARLLKLIGEELISDDVVAISELVKNAHDADALAVTVFFRGVTGPHGEIEVRDDGCGMDLDTLLGRWMEPAATTKGRADRKLTSRGRRVLGEKGVGRFAADKLARNLEIVSRPPGAPDEIRALINWDLFDDGDRMLEEISNQWQLRPAQVIAKHGTILRMTGLRTIWTERMFRRLSIRLGRLLSPFRERDRFAIWIESDEFPQYSGDLRSEILEKAPYRIEARFDGRQVISLRTGKTRLIEQRWNGQRELTCGPVKIRLFAFDLEGEALARIGPRMEVRAWLKEWTGVSIYRDGFRIWPYGEPHDDWLRLDQRRVNNPVEHLSNNQVIGFIDISRDGNPELMDQTNREGLMNNRALEDLRRLVYFVLQILESERQSVRHPIRRVPVSLNGKLSSDGAMKGEIEELAQKADPALGREIRELAGRLLEQTAREETTRARLLEGYAGLAAIGQMATTLLPVLPRDVGQMQSDLQAVRKVLVSLDGAGQLEALDRLAATLGAVSQRLQLMQFAAGGSDRRRAIDLIAELSAFRASLEPVLKLNGVSIEVEYPEGEVLRTEMRPEHFQSLLHLLAANSLDWLSKSDSPRIRIVVSADDEDCELVFSDNGPGIPPQFCQRVFEPQFSLKEGGRGMGLAIARQIINSHGGKIYVILDGRRRGANLRLVLPRKRSRATFRGASEEQ
jgi:signal transduction histidine kinase